MALPTTDRPTMPDGYGIPSGARGLLTWDQVEAELVSSTHYWLASVRPDGRPHVVPRWGVWLEGAFWYDGAPTTRHAVNAEANPEVALHLESGVRAVVVEGRSRRTRADPAGLGVRLAEAFSKYHDLGYQPGPESWSGSDGGGLRVIRPRRALCWFDFPTDCTRFRFV
ncbi:pyridoxamine 5'-phosphate oxidase [Marmoricola endophyticus]|uniref:Pyridoxamine 5'-phosphate oxidase n=1 Tax=Marmoricola endophyticus TaxID=2040280 RepID=A0A917BA91_9ACTN|nr:pyridoxamine 5'-phosphate oxidase family protein [Marmoricola endophyticus]GGF30647.1 pyridoxamine 5'-phosphate oxidase [Marmoricola endophyticus]